MVFSVVVCLSLNPVSALAPIVTSLEYSTTGTDTILTINIEHTLPGAGDSGVVSAVEVDVDGTIYTMSINDPGTSTFSVEYNMGAVTGNPIVRARAEESTAGWGDWCNPITIPEFPLSHLLLFFLVISIAVMFLRLKIYHPNRPIK